jgi:hypothetical protein
MPYPCFNLITAKEVAVVRLCNRYSVEEHFLQMWVMSVAWLWTGGMSPLLQRAEKCYSLHQTESNRDRDASINNVII